MTQSKRQSEEQSLTTEHNALIQIEKEDECYTPPYGDERTNYIERHYVANYTAKIFENLRFYKRKGGKTVALYVNPKTGKSMKNPTSAYMKEVDEALKNTIAPLRRIDIEALIHIRAHIHQKILKNQRETVRRLIKEKEKK